MDFPDILISPLSHVIHDSSGVLYGMQGLNSAFFRLGGYMAVARLS